MYKSRILSAVSGLALLATTPAFAQTMNYGSLQELFGEPVTTAATGKPQRASESPVPMTIVTQEQIQQYGASNVPDAIRYVSGIDIIQFSRYDNEVAVRGYNGVYSPRLLVLINGRQVYLDHYGMTNWAALPVAMAEIRQIEIVKGPNSALFGFNAAAGVVNIVTYNPLYDDVDSVTVRAGTQNTAETEFVTTQKINESVGLRLSGTASRGDDFETPLQVAGSTRDDAHRISFNADVLAQVNASTQFNVEGSFVDTQRTEVNNALTVVDYRTYSAKTSVVNDGEYGLLKASLYKNWLEVDFSATSGLDQSVIVAQLEDLIKIGSAHTVRLSGEYRHNQMDSNFSTLSTPNQESHIAYDVYSAGAMWDWAITQDLNWTNSLRLDHQDVSKTGFQTTIPNTTYSFTNAAYDQSSTLWSANTGLVYRATDLDTFRLTFGRGLQTPSLLTSGIFVPVSATPLPIYLVGNANLETTVVQNYEFGYERKVADIFSTISANVFYQTNKHIVGTRTTTYTRTLPNGAVVPAAVISQFSDTGDTNLVGFELALRGSKDAFNWDLNYAYANLDDEFLPGVTTSEERTPGHRVNLTLGYTAGDWLGSVRGQYVSHYNNGGVNLSDYQRFDTSIGYKLTEGMTVGVTASNLFGKHYEGRHAEVERQVLASLRTNF